MLVHKARIALVAIAGTLCLLLNTAVAAQTSLKAGAQTGATRNATIVLNRGWLFRQVAPATDPEGGWMPATVPGDVHLDLLANKKIPDPYYRDNESKLQDIQNQSWEYRLAFDVAPTLLSRSNLDLVFDGLDGPSQVYLNGSLVLTGTNSFRVWRIPAKSFLQAGKNDLRVVFESPVKAAAALAAADPWQAKTKTAPKTYLRKPAYEYGWDWGPTFVTSGIWRAARIEAWDKVRIADFAIRQHDITNEVAHVDAEFQIEAARAGLANVAVRYTDGTKPAAVSKAFDLHAGLNTVTLPIEIRQPKLWWPAGYGDQPLYEFTASVNTGTTNAASSDERKLKTGLRSIVLDRHPDKWGRSFQFVVNGVPVFAKGADVIPFDSFPNRVTTADYRRILESARDANMNMIRHWGGGYYETDEFYQICDELGIMVWQDFMFGNDWQPGTYSFKLNIEAEAEDQVRRLRNHPSIVLWCGNNETEGAILWNDRWKLACRCALPDVAGLPHGIQRHPSPRGGPSSARNSVLAQFTKLGLRGAEHSLSERRRPHLGRVARPRSVLNLRNPSRALRHRIRIPIISGDANYRSLHRARRPREHPHAGDARAPEEQRRQFNHPRLPAQGLPGAERLRQLPLRQPGSAG